MATTLSLRSLVRVCRRHLTSDGYLHKTVIPTYHFQNSLPKLPLPKLEDTLEKYLSSAQPLVSSEEYAQTKSFVEAFQSGTGAELHDQLAAENKRSKTSYIAEPWYDMYLRYREPLPINMNPQLTMKDDPDPVKQQQGARTASLVSASVAFYRTLRDQHLKPDLYETKPHLSGKNSFQQVVKYLPSKLPWVAGFAVGAYALDMSQYKRLFRTTRLPRLERDEHVTYDEAQSRHVIAQYGHQFFKVPVLHEDGTAVAEGELRAAFEKILSQPPNCDVPALGALTSLPRDEWARVRTAMMADPVNKKALQDIDTALFAICLEHETTGSEPMQDLETITNDQWINLIECMLYGKGRNRWYDKSFQLIVSANAKASVNFEHGWGDGVAVLRYFNEIYQESINNNVAAAKMGVQPELVQFNVGKELEASVNDAEQQFDAFRNMVECKLLQSQNITTELLKEVGLGTDGALQMAFQLAHYRLKGHNASTYESASTAGFRHGRTETIRSCTPESDAFVRAFCDPAASHQVRNDLMRAAVKNHGKISKDCLLGKGWDRHLFALKNMAERQGLPVPDIFTDPTYEKLNKIILSTSTLASPALDAGGFGPVNEDCFGIGYGVADIGARFIVMTYKLETQAFLDCLDQALIDMMTVAKGDNF